MDLILTFSDGRISGDGCDGIGSFVIEGDYSEKALDCSWVKTYRGRHSVEYRGCKEGKYIWGTWTLPTRKGGFQIWPIGSQPNLKNVVAAEDVELTDLLSQPSTART